MEPASLSAFVAHVEARARSAEPEWLWSCEKAFADFIASGAVTEALEAQLEAIALDPAHIVEASSHLVWTVAASDHFDLTVHAVAQTEEQRLEYLYGSPRDRLLAALGPGASEVHLYQHGSEHPPEVFDKSLALISLGPQSLRPGEVLRLRAWMDVADVLPVPTASFVICLSAFSQQPLQWTYRRDTLTPHAPLPADRHTNLLEYGAWALVQLGHSEAANAFRRLAGHPAHHVRWTAVRAAMEVDAAAGTELLRQALADPHPHLRSAARRNLERLGMTEEGESWQ